MAEICWIIAPFIIALLGYLTGALLEAWRTRKRK